MLWFLKIRHEEEESSLSFLENGSKLLEGLASASNCGYDIPYRNFTAKELINATNNFRVLVMDDGTGFFFRGLFQQRQILVKRFHDHGFWKDWPSYINCDIVITLMMSHHKNVMKFLGCCLDFYAPALVYEYADHDRLLYDILYNSKEQTSRKEGGSLSWRNRIKIATDIGNALVYLHTAFATPIIHRDFSTRNIVIDQYGVAKLLNFSLCKILPPGESQVEDLVIGRTDYLDPEYAMKGIVTEKSDVYMFGVFLLVLLTAKRPIDLHHECSNLVDDAKDHMGNNCLNKILDNIILEEIGEAMKQQLQAVTDLASKCCEPKGEDRPNMIDVAKELSRIERSGRSG